MHNATRVLLIAASALQGAWMMADGIHSLSSGHYFGPRLGPWASVVSRTGIHPLSLSMRSSFVLFGLAWLCVLLAQLVRARRAPVLALGAGVLTLWYLPIGTLLSTVAIVCAAMQLRETAKGRT